MDTSSLTIHLKDFVFIHVGNSTLAPLQKHVHQSDHLLNMVDKQKTKRITKIIFNRKELIILRNGKSSIKRGV